MSKKAAPLGAGLEVKSQPVIVKEANKHLDRFVLCFEDLDLRDRRLSTDYVHAGRITRLVDISYADRDLSEEALTRENLPNDLEHPNDIIVVKTAYDSALELYAAYGERGLIILESLTGADTQTIKAIEKELLGDIPVSLIQFHDDLSARAGLGGIGLRVRDEVLKCLEITINYRADIVNKAETEIAQRALPNGVGLDRITSGVKFYASSLDHVLEIDKLDMLARKSQEPVKVTLEAPAAQPALSAADIVAIVAETVKATMEATKTPAAKK